MKRMEGRGGIDAARPHSESVTNMKRVLSLLLAAAFAGASPALAQTEASPVAQIGDTTYTDALAAFTALKDGETLVLLDDCVCAKTPTVKAFGVTVDLNGHTLWGKYEASLKKNAGSGLKFEPTSSMSPSKPEYNYFRVIDSSEGKTGTIKGQLPVRASTGNSQNRAFLDIAETVTLTPTTDAFGSVCVELGTGTRVPAETRYIAWLGSEQPLFKATDGENASWIFPKFGNAAPYAADGVVTLCADYSGSEQLTLSGKTLTLDLDGHTYEFLAATGSKTEIVTCSSSDTHMTIRNGTLKGNCGGVTYAPPPEETIRDCSLTLENVTLASTFAAVGHGFGLSANGTMENIDFTLRDCKLLLGPFAAEADGTQTLAEPDANADIQAIYFPPRGDSTLTIEDTVIKSPYGVQVCAGNLVVSGNTQITVTADNLAATKEGDGSIPDGAAISIVSRAGYGDIGTVTISGTPTLIAKGANATAVATYAWNGTDKTQADWAEDAKHVTILGGSFSHAPAKDLLADGVVAIKDESAPEGTTVTLRQFAAQCGNRVYASLRDAVINNQASGLHGETITVLRDVTEENVIVVGATLIPGATDSNVVIDLNGHTVTFEGNTGFQITENGALSLTGEGRVVANAAEGTGVVRIFGSQNDRPDECVLHVGEQVTLEGTVGIAVYQGHPDAAKCYGVSVTVEGTIVSHESFAAYINGTNKNTEGNVPHFTFTETSAIQADTVAVYAAGYGKWDFAGDVSAGSDALSIKSGDIAITGGVYTAAGEYNDPASANGNGTENTGAVVSITTNSGYAQKTSVNISGGTFTSTNGNAFYEGIAKDTDGNPAAEASTAVIAISDGTFKGAAGKDAIVIATAEDKRVITGGAFSTAVPEEYCDYGYTPVATPNAEGMYTVEHPMFTKVGVLMADGDYTIYDSMYAALYDTTKLARENAKATVIVLEDTSLDSFFRVLAGQEVTLDLNGHVLTCTGGPGYTYAIDWVCGDDVTAKPHITITDSSVGQTGVMRAEGAHLDGLVRMVGGKLTITGGRFVQAVDNPEAQYKNNIFVLTEGLTVAPEEGRTVDVSGGTIRVEATTSATVQAYGTQIRGGTFHSTEGRPAIEVAHVSHGMVISGGAFEGDGDALRMSAPATVTVEGGDFTDGAIDVANAGATLLLKGGDLTGTTLTGAGTVSVGSEVTDLSMSKIADLGALAVSGNLALGANRPTGTDVSASAEAVLSVAATETELNAGKVAVFAANGDAVPANVSLSLANVPEGQAIVDAETVVADGTLALTFTALPEDVAADNALVATLLPYLDTHDIHNVATFSGTTDGGTQTLTLAEIADALEVFQVSDGLVTAEGKALEVAYDFGIASATLVEGGTLTVVARVQGADGKSVTFAPGTTVQLLNAADTAAEPLAAIAIAADAAATDTVTFTGVALPTGADALSLAVRVVPPAQE